MQPAVFLDRDNTIIHNDGDLGDPNEVRLIQGAASAIASLCGLGYKIVVITNQGGVARGKYTEDDVHAVHERIRELVTHASNGARIDAFYFCPYHPKGTVEKYRKEHPTRKPQPGMLKQAAKDLKLELRRSWMIGDQLRDIEAGKAAGCRTVLLRPDADRIAPDEMVELPEEVADAEENAADQAAGDASEVEPDVVARNLIEAVRVIAQHRKPDAAEEGTRSVTHMRGAKRWDAAAIAQLQQPRKGHAQEQAQEQDQDQNKPDAPAQQAQQQQSPPRDEDASDEPDATRQPQGQGINRANR